MDYRLLYSILLSLRQFNNSVFLWNGRVDRENYRSFIFLNPREIISTTEPFEIKACFERMQERLEKGFYVAGYISYEAGLFFENILAKKTLKPFCFPLLWFGVYKRPLIYDHKRSAFIPKSKDSLLFLKNAEGRLGNYTLSNVRKNIKDSTYLGNIKRVKDYIRRGHTYQVNYTFKYKFNYGGSPFKLFYDLNRKQSVSYSTFINSKDIKILSLSPELFFRRTNNKLYVMPMKGTINRGTNESEDESLKKTLFNCPKNRAENVMIVDLLRNDLGRVSKTGSVITKRLFQTHKYETLFQMTSTIGARLNNNIDWHNIFYNIFPSGSVTGAPKIRTMQIIKEIEKEPRNIYTGSIGYISPQKQGVFNVAIRTVVLNAKEKTGEMGIGSGITISSNAENELKECRVKADFLIKERGDFKLIETILWEKNRFFLLNLHLKRLKDSCKYFGFNYNKPMILESLHKRTIGLDNKKKYKVRLLLDKDGNITITSSILKDSVYNKEEKIAISKKRTDSSSIFLYHKTTNRSLYNKEFQKYRKPGFLDVIFLNQRDEVTEGAISNIFIKKNNTYYTPPVNCGLLNGAYRQYLFKKPGFKIKEKILKRSDLETADKIYLTNAVWGRLQKGTLHKHKKIDEVSKLRI